MNVNAKKMVTDIDKKNESKNLEQIEEVLDAEIDAYNKYTEKNPMQGISWVEKLNTWKIKSDEYIINTKNTSLERATALIIDKICNGTKNQRKILKTDAITKIAYKQRQI